VAPRTTSVGAVVLAFIISGIILKLVGDSLTVAKFASTHLWQLACFPTRW
jgi:hypothetical protein